MVEGSGTGAGVSGIETVLYPECTAQTYLGWSLLEADWAPPVWGPPPDNK